MNIFKANKKRKAHDDFSVCCVNTKSFYDGLNKVFIKLKNVFLKRIFLNFTCCFEILCQSDWREEFTWVLKWKQILFFFYPTRLKIR